jgi:hypothetical protein
VHDSVALIAVPAADHAREFCVDRGHSWDSINRYGLGHLARHFQSLWALRKPRVLPSPDLLRGAAAQSKPSSPANAPPPGSSSSTPASPLPRPASSTPPSPSSSPSPLSSSLSSRPPPRSFSSVVMAGQRLPQAGLQGTAARPPVPATPLQQGAPPRPPPSTSAPGGGLQGGRCRHSLCRSGQPPRDLCSSYSLRRGRRGHRLICRFRSRPCSRGLRLFSRHRVISNLLSMRLMVS